MYQAAKHAFSVVMSGQLSREVRLRTIAELVELGAMTGDRVTFERWRRELSGSYDDLPPEDQVDYELKVGTGLASFGHNGPAERHLQRAIDLAEQHRLGERLFTAEAVLKELRDTPVTTAGGSERLLDEVVLDGRLGVLVRREGLVN